MPCLIVLVAASAAASDCPVPEFVARADIAGLGMAEVRGDRIDVSLYGYAEAPDACITEDTVFEAASLTKPVVAYLVLRLVDAGRLDLDDELIDHLPTLPLPTDDPRSATVTIRMALAHSSGLDGSDDQTLSFISEPGETFRYYPAGYRLVQRVVEHLEGESLETVARREVFEPLGMRSSSLVFREDLVGRVATRHRMLGDPITRERDPAVPANAAASLITTPGDYGLFLRDVLHGDGLSDTSRQSMLTPQVTVPETDGRVAWGVGWALEPDRGTFFHYGDDGAAKSFVIGSLETDAAIVYFANSYYGMAIAGEIAARLVAGDSPGVAWLGYSTWDAPRRLLRRDTLRAFVEGDADQGMETFQRYLRQHPELDYDKTARFLVWVLESRGKHEGRARLLAWQIEQEPENLDLYLNLAQSQRAMGELPAAVESLTMARDLAGDSEIGDVEAQLEWIGDEILAQDSSGGEPAGARSLLAGQYDTWRVFDEDDGLVFETGSGNRYPLRWMHGTLYALEGIDWFRLRFVVEDGRATKVVGLYADGRRDESMRTEDGS